MIYQCLEHQIERFTVIPDQYGIPLQCFRTLFTNNTIPQSHKHIQFTCTSIILQTKVCTLKKLLNADYQSTKKEGKIVKSISCPLYKIILTTLHTG